MASAINSLIAGASSAGSSTASGTQPSTGASAPSEQLFLTLLVSQIKNQDPLNPADSTQFVSQLAQFSELEQVIGIRGDIEGQIQAADPTTSGSSTDSGTGTAANTKV